MAGFFKKLFNRITGKPTEEAVPAEVEHVALPAPEPEPEIVVEVEEPQKVEKAKAKPVAKTPAKSKAPPPEPPKKVVSKKEAPKPSAKKLLRPRRLHRPRPQNQSPHRLLKLRHLHQL